MAMYEKFKEEAFLPRLSVCFYGCISSWREHFSSGLKPLMHAYQVGLRTGDVESAAVSPASRSNGLRSRHRL
jgi:hypothetical protein